MMALIQCMRVNVDGDGWYCRSYGVKGGDVLAFESTLTAIAPGNIRRGKADLFELVPEKWQLDRRQAPARLPIA